MSHHACLLVTRSHAPPRFAGVAASKAGFMLFEMHRDLMQVVVSRGLTLVRAVAVCLVLHRACSLLIHASLPSPLPD